MPQSRNDRGQFAAKSDANREVRSIRLTDETWTKLGELADSRGVTRADLVEQIVELDLLNRSPSEGELSLQQVVAAVDKVLDDPKITRNGKDKGSVRRALHALLEYLS